MCDYSLQSVLSRPAKVGDKLATRNFGTGTRGFAAPEAPTTAVCVLPGTELAFFKKVECAPAALFGGSRGRSTIRRQYFGKSARISRWYIMMDSNFRTDKWFS